MQHAPARPDAPTDGVRRRAARAASRAAAAVAGVGLLCQTGTAQAESPVQLRADFGFLGVLQHDYQQGDPGTSFDFHDEGAQDVLFPVSRYIVNVDVAERHRVSFVYQPLELRTRERLRRDILVDGTAYAAGQDMQFTYGFPFYRASYEYVAWHSDEARLGLGGGLQIRNATIEFAHSDGTNLVSERNVGPVPLLHASFRQALGELYWFELDADGIYAPIKYLNGNDNGVEGAILDANVRLGIDAAEHIAPFLNVRYLGGGAEGASEEGDLADYTSNWLQFMIVSLGVELH
ncbi:MAG TPA: hypothetical protein VMG12_41295 [Polyangiaceae bacterium]|nr:hypothetical protein [Polyangiaceae bacterium]